MSENKKSLSKLEIIGEVIKERKRQDDKWGEQNHSPMHWMPILMEEVGEASKHTLETHFGASDDSDYKAARAELIQTAAVAIAMIESIDRNKWRTEGFWYLATPYAKYPSGHDAAFRAAAEQAAILMQSGLKVFCPISHTHTIRGQAALDNTDHDFWLRQDEAIMRHAVGMIECRLPGWAESRGMQWEREQFASWKKPIIQMVPFEFPELLVGYLA